MSNGLHDHLAWAYGWKLDHHRSTNGRPSDPSPTQRPNKSWARCSTAERQYALACTAFHRLTGGPPLTNTNPAVVIGNHLSSPPHVCESSVPVWLRSMTHWPRGMAKEPFQRFDTCREFTAALAHGSFPAPRREQRHATDHHHPRRPVWRRASEIPIRSRPDSPSSTRRRASIVGRVSLVCSRSDWWPSSARG